MERIAAFQLFGCAIEIAFDLKLLGQSVFDFQRPLFGTRDRAAHESAHECHTDRNHQIQHNPCLALDTPNDQLTIGAEHKPDQRQCTE